jgi:hypothetical protein
VALALGVRDARLLLAQARQDVGGGAGGLGQVIQQLGVLCRAQHLQQRWGCEGV